MNITSVMQARGPLTAPSPTAQSRTAARLRRPGRRAPSRGAWTAPPPKRVDGRLEESGRSREVECPGQEPVHRDLVGRDQGGRGARPDRPASRAIRSAGKRRSSGARKSSRSAAERSGAVAGDGAGRVGHGVLDGKAHVGDAELGLQRAVDERTASGRGSAGGSRRRFVICDIVQPVRFDDLQALVREGRRVDGDLRAHRPRRMAQGLAGGSPRSASRAKSERAARGGEDEAGNASIDPPARHCQMAECSESIGRSQASGLGQPVGRIVAAALGQRPGQRHHEVSAGDQRLLVGRRHDLARNERREDRPEADDAAGRRRGQNGRRHGSRADEGIRPAHRYVPAGRSSRAAASVARRRPRSSRAGSSAQDDALPARWPGPRPERRRRARRARRRLTTDGPRRSEQGDPDRAGRARAALSPKER